MASTSKDNNGNAQRKASPCCPPGALPELVLLKEDYTPLDERFDIPAVPDTEPSSACEVYVTGASPNDDDSWSGKPVVVVWCDSFGPWSGTHRKLADEIAQQTNGIVIVPDPFQGQGGLCPQYSDEQDQPSQLGLNKFTFDLIVGMIWNGWTFLKQYPWDAHHQPLITKQLLPYLASKDVAKFAMIGMCYGSWLTMKCCNDPEIVQHVSCGIHYHPSSELMEKSTFGRDDIALCQRCSKPQLIHATKNESDAWKPNGKAHQAFIDNPNVPEIQFSLAPNTQSHGFMTRVDCFRDPVGRQAVQEGLKLALSFLKEYNH